MTQLVSGYLDYSPDLTLSYEVVMANPQYQGNEGTLTPAGLNIVAFGIPENYSFNNISSSTFAQFFLRNTFDYLSYISISANAAVACVIQDYF